MIRNPEEIVEILALHNMHVIDISPVSGGVNSLLFKASIRTTDVAIKVFPLSPVNNISRAKREHLILTEINRIKPSYVPSVFRFLESYSILVMEWIEALEDNGDVLDAFRASTFFLHDITRNLTSETKSQIGFASDFCSTYQAHLDNLKTRSNTLSIHEHISPLHAHVRKWVDLQVLPRLDQLFHDKPKDIQRYFLPLSDDYNLVFSQSDVGLHNMISSKNGFTFIDFEYAGLDDPAKYAVDWLLQPNLDLDYTTMSLIISELRSCQFDPMFFHRIEALLYPSVFRWIFIVLKAFSTDETYKQQQLEAQFFKAQRLIGIDTSLIIQYVRDAAYSTLR